MTEWHVDWEAMATESKSLVPPDEFAAAYAAGVPVWDLDTGTDGEDDLLTGSYQEVVDDLLEYHEMAELPAHWELTEVTLEEAATRWPLD